MGRPTPGKRAATDALRRVLQQGGARAIRIDLVRSFERGPNRQGFWADATFERDEAEQAERFAILVTLDPADEERLAREVDFLRALGRLDPPIRVPHVEGVDTELGFPVVVESVVRGMELDVRAGHQGRIEPWDIIGSVAAAIHGVDTSPWLAIEPDGPDTRRAHAEREIKEAFADPPDGADTGLLREAEAWARESAPPPTPAVGLHGELRGFNILFDPFDEETPGVVDWGNARLGDPAYDLAMVTRGKARPFLLAGGLRRLLEAYHTHGGAVLAAAEVHVHELCLAVRWYRDQLTGARDDDRAGARVRAVLDRGRAAPEP